MTLQPHTRLAIDPDIRLKNDVTRAALLARPAPIAYKSLFALVHPKDAVILALFNGDRTVAEVKRLWAELADHSEDVSAMEVDAAIERHEKALIEVDEGNRAAIVSYDPAEFVVTAQDIDLSEARLRKPYPVLFIPSLLCPQRCLYCYS